MAIANPPTTTSVLLAILLGLSGGRAVSAIGGGAFVASTPLAYSSVGHPKRCSYVGLITGDGADPSSVTSTVSDKSREAVAPGADGGVGERSGSVPLLGLTFLVSATGMGGSPLVASGIDLGSIEQGSGVVGESAKVQLMNGPTEGSANADIASTGRATDIGAFGVKLEDLATSQEATEVLVDDTAEVAAAIATEEGVATYSAINEDDTSTIDIKGARLDGEVDPSTEVAVGERTMDDVLPSVKDDTVVVEAIAAETTDKEDESKIKGATLVSELDVSTVDADKSEETNVDSSKPDEIVAKPEDATGRQKPLSTVRHFDYQAAADDLFAADAAAKDGSAMKNIQGRQGATPYGKADDAKPDPIVEGLSFKLFDTRMVSNGSGGK